jgi:hypothetical protein
MNANHEAVFILEKPLFVPADQTVEFTLSHELNDNYLVGRFAIDVAETAPAEPLPYERSVVEALTTPRESARRSRPGWWRLRLPRPKSSASRAKKRRRPQRHRELMVMKELDKPRETFVALRGDFLRPDKNVGPLVRDVLRMPFRRCFRPNRAAHAARPGPLAGASREPAHAAGHDEPRLDALLRQGAGRDRGGFWHAGNAAVAPRAARLAGGEFIRRGWSLKEMHRLIVTSSVYRQSSARAAGPEGEGPAQLAAGAAGKAAGSRRRSCATRPGRQRPLGPHDRRTERQAAAARGRLRLHAERSGGWRIPVRSRYRRAMYTAFYRSAPHPLFTTFDAPDFQTVCTRRPLEHAAAGA